MKKFIVTFLCVCPLLITGQNVNSSVENKLFKLNFLSPGAAYELRLADKMTLELGVETGLYFESGNRRRNYGIGPLFSFNYRYYYNFPRRQRKGKRTDFNSAHFIGVRNYVSFRDLYFGNVNGNESFAAYGVQSGLVWGIQHTFKSKFNIVFDLGVGYSFGPAENELGLLAGLSLGYVIAKRNKDKNIN